MITISKSNSTVTVPTLTGCITHSETVDKCIANAKAKEVVEPFFLSLTIDTQTQAMTITDDILQEANMTEAELKMELAVLLYQKQKLSMGLAARLADMDRIHFQLLLGSRQILVNYDEAAFEEDLQTIERLKVTSPDGGR
ncbi:UPF0175 family protein [Spirosoma arcticum]